MKTCEICDRPIRTGRKYCWEHRRTAQAEALQGGKIVDKATQAYLEYHTKRNHQILYAITAIFYLPLII